MADALLSTPVAVTASLTAAALICVAGSKVKKNTREEIIPLMGVMGAFVFAAQMVNFSIPGTGSSGHIVGGVLLAAMLGPWAAFLTLSSVLIIQCLIFADGGLMALGCNIINMAAMSTLVAYPLIFKPIAGMSISPGRLIGASLAACIVGLELGAVMVTVETSLSGITALPAAKFLLLMTAIHLAIGVGEGLATGAILSFVARTQPDLLSPVSRPNEISDRRKMKKLLIGFAIATIIVGGGIAFLASTDPDGLEWSILKMTGSTDLPADQSTVASAMSGIQSATSIMPDYDNTFSGIIGSIMVLAMVWAVTSVIFRYRSLRHRGREA